MSMNYFAVKADRAYIRRRIHLAKPENLPKRDFRRQVIRGTTLCGTRLAMTATIYNFPAQLPDCPKCRRIAGLGKNVFKAAL